MTLQLFFTDKTKTISSQFSPPLTQDLQPTRSTAQTPIFYFCPLTEAEVSKLLLSSHTGPLEPIPSHLLQAISSTLLPALTHYQHISPHRHLPHCIQAGSGNATSQNTYIKHFSYRKLQTCLSPSIIVKTLEQDVFKQVSLFLSQNNKLDAKQSGFRSGHSTETALLSVTEALRITVCRFWHCQLSDPPVHPLITGHHWDSTSLVWILSHWSVFQCGLGRGGIQSTLIGHWGSPGIGSWTSPLIHIHYITGSHHTGTWLLLPFLCWWHTALSLISTRWPNGSCTDLSLPGRHLGMDERKSPTAQPCKDWASCLPCHSNSTAWLHDSVSFINNYPISFGQKSWCNLWWPADL